jgi:hypothetical protein
MMPKTQRSRTVKAEITKLTLRLKDREIELTAQEAREVHAELSKLFDLEQETRKEFVPVPYPISLPYPIIIDRTPAWPRPWEHPWQITWCGNELGTTLCMDIGQKNT